MPARSVEALDGRDRAILRLLQGDGRITNAELAAKVNLSPSACLRRVRALEEDGFILGTTAVLGEAALGYTGVAFVQVTLDGQGRAALDRFEAAVARHPEILDCYLLAGAADYLVRIAYRDAPSFERIHTDILTQLPGVSRLQSTVTLRTVKRSAATVPDETLTLSTSAGRR